MNAADRWFALEGSVTAVMVVDVEPVVKHRGELEAAHEHLDSAAELFARHGAAKLYLDQVLSKKEILKA